MPMSLVVDSDETLLEKALREEDPHRRRDRFNELFSRHHQRVALWCLRFTSDRETAADLAQEIFLKVYDSSDSYRGQARFSTWLYSVTRNHCLNHAQSQKRRREALEAGASSSPVNEFSDPLEGLDRERKLDLIRRLIKEKLTAIEKRVIKLRFGDELPLETVTRLLDLKNKSGAKAYLVSAKRKLRRAVEKTEAGRRLGSPAGPQGRGS